MYVVDGNPEEGTVATNPIYPEIPCYLIDTTLQSLVLVTGVGIPTALLRLKHPSVKHFTMWLVVILGIIIASGNFVAFFGQYHLIDRRIALIIPHITWGFAVFIFKIFLDSMEKDVTCRSCLFTRALYHRLVSSDGGYDIGCCSCCPVIPVVSLVA
jgi:hypothetical protein